MVFTGVAGSVYARYVHFVDPTALSFHYTVTVVSMVIVGGQGSIAGTALGAAPLHALAGIPARGRAVRGCSSSGRS